MWIAVFTGAICLAAVVCTGQRAMARCMAARVEPRPRDLQHVLEHRTPPDRWGRRSKRITWPGWTR